MINMSEYKKEKRRVWREQGLCPECGGTREELRWKLSKEGI